MRTIYLAGPEVFLPNAAEVGARKKSVCERYGLAGLFPLDKEIPIEHRSPETVAAAIYRANIALIAEADALIANLTPFRGPSMDVGTAFEIGFAVARDIPVFGYSNEQETMVERILGKPSRISAGARLVDSEGLEIENFGFLENLMIEVPIRMTGVSIVSGNVSPYQRFTDLRLFEECVRIASEHFQISRTKLRARR